MNPSGTDIRRMLAKAREEKARLVKEDLVGHPYVAAPRAYYVDGVEAALAWILGEWRGPPIA